MSKKSEAERGEKYWRKQLRAWKRSGLACKEFAAREGLKAGTLSWWNWQIRKRDAEQAVVPEPLTFIELGSVGSAVAESFEIVLGTGVRVRVPMTFDAEALGRLLEVLERRA